MEEQKWAPILKADRKEWDIGKHRLTVTDIDSQLDKLGKVWLGQGTAVARTTIPRGASLTLPHVEQLIILEMPVDNKAHDGSVYWGRGGWEIYERMENVFRERMENTWGFFLYPFRIDKMTTGRSDLLALQAYAERKIQLLRPRSIVTFHKGVTAFLSRIASGSGIVLSPHQWKELSIFKLSIATCYCRYPSQDTPRGDTVRALVAMKDRVIDETTREAMRIEEERKARQKKKDKEAREKKREEKEALLGKRYRQQMDLSSHGFSIPSRDASAVTRKRAKTDQEEEAANLDLASLVRTTDTSPASSAKPVTKKQLTLFDLVMKNE